ncbi:lipopolysaccharide biosynthesis protein [Myroides phaeus]|uniref:lipopolysaccharide biosynthesis protein n=1 Tax=Myroides phaeus TaxID=702745 RepID=UPI0013036BBC|nr:lipopolysaccharide biosynthesis protein [Myroides phaeus]
MSLRNKTINGVIWSAIQSIGTKIIQLLITIIIARVLMPEDYGLVGMLFIFIALGNVIIDAGFSQALIRKENVSEIEYSSVFYFNVIMGLFIYIVLYFFAPLIADFYNEPILLDISRLSFLIFPISACGVVQYTKLSREINFKLLAKISLLATFISGFLGIVMAYLDQGVWSLVWQSLVFSIIQVALYWWYSKWKPLFVFSLKPISNLISFSLSLLSTNVLIVVFNNLYTLIIGKVYNVDTVGYYNQAKRFEEIPTQTLTTIIQKVSFPILSQLQSDDVKLKSGYRKVINMAVYLNFPLMIMLIVVAEDLFTVLLGAKWILAVPYFQLLCLHGVFFPLHSINVNILKVKNRGKKLLSLEIVRRLLMIIAIVLTLPLGVYWLLVGHVIASLISIIINMYYCGKEISFSLIQQFKDVLPTLILSIVCGLIVYTVHFLNIEVSVYIKLIFQIASGAFLYLMFSIFFKIESYRELIKIVKSKIK